MLCLGHSGIMKLNRLFSLTYRSCVNNIFILNVRYSFHYTFRFKIENAKVSRTILKLQKNIYFFLPAILYFLKLFVDGGHTDALPHPLLLSYLKR